MRLKGKIAFLLLLALLIPINVYCVDLYYYAKYNWCLECSDKTFKGCFVEGEYIPKTVIGKQNCYYISSFKERGLRHAAGNTIIEPLVNKEGFVTVFSGNRWIYLRDYRGVDLWWKINDYNTIKFEDGRKDSFNLGFPVQTDYYGVGDLPYELTAKEPPDLPGSDIRWDYFGEEWSEKPIRDEPFFYFTFKYSSSGWNPDEGRLAAQHVRNTKQTVVQPPHDIKEGFVAIFHEDISISGGGYWSIEKDYKHIPVWNKKGAARMATTMSIWNGECGEKPAPENFYKHSQKKCWWSWHGTLPVFLTDQEPEWGQSWDYATEEWSFNPVQPESFSDLGEYDLSAFELPSALSLIFSNAFKQIDANVNAIVSLDSTIGELAAKSPEIIIPDNIVTIEQAGEIRFDQFALKDKKYVYSFPDDVAIDDAIFFMSDDMRGSINVHITYKVAHNRYNVWFFQKALRKLKKKFEYLNEADCFVKWQTYEH